MLGRRSAGAPPVRTGTLSRLTWLTSTPDRTRSRQTGSLGPEGGRKWAGHL